MDTTMLNIRNLFEQLVRRVEILSEGNELRKSFWAGLWEKKKQISDLGFLHSQAKLFFILSYLKKKKQRSVICDQSFMDMDSKWSLFFFLWLFLNGSYSDFFVIKVLFLLNCWH